MIDPQSPEQEAESLPTAFDEKLKGYETENGELRQRVAELEAELERQATMMEMRTAALENRAQVVREMISFQLGAAILEVLKSPGKALALPSTLWKIHLDAEKRKATRAEREELALKGPKFQQVLTVLRSEGLSAVMDQLIALRLSPEAVAATLGAMSREIAISSPSLAIAAAREAYKLDPKPNRAKWLAFRLFDQGAITEPAGLVRDFASVCVLSASEQKRAEGIATQAKLKASFPKIPSPAAPYEGSTARSLLYVAASAMPYHTTGYTSRTQELLVALKNSGAAVTALTRPGYPWDREDRYALPLENSTTFEGVAYLHRKTPSMNLPLDLYVEEAARVIADVAKKRKVAAIHAASNYSNALPALIAARNLGIPFSYEMRGLWNLTRASKVPGYEESEHFRLQMDLEAHVARHSDKVYVISKALGSLVENLDVEPRRIHVLPNCVNPSTIAKAREQAGPKLKAFTLGYAGSLVAYEGLDLLVEALAALKNRGVTVRARIIGEGPCREELGSLAARHNVSGQIEFLGRLHPDAARARLMETHAVVLPRRPDKVCELIPPIKLAEAQAMNLRIIASDVNAMRIELEGNSLARIFPSGSTASLADCIDADFQAFQKNGQAGAGSSEAASIRTWADYVPEILSVFSLPRAE